VFDYQRVPSAVPALPHSSTLAKRARSSSSRQRRSRDRSSSKSTSRPHSSSKAKLKMEELQTIKRELTMIKVQIDGLLDSLDRMDRQRQEHTGSPFSHGGSSGGSPYHPSTSSREGSPRTPSPRRCARRDTPELGEASDDEPHMIASTYSKRCIITTLTWRMNCKDEQLRTTNSDGRCPGLITREAFGPGAYKMRFETEQYWERLGETCFYPYVEIVFTITDASQKFHIPLLLSRFSYSTTPPVSKGNRKPSRGGKRDEELILPINSSLSVTLHQDQLKTTTTVACSRTFQEDRIWLNGREEDINQPRLQSCLQEIRRLARKRRNDEDPNAEVTLSHRVHICSVNNFPTAAGLASSAAGYACLVYSLSRLFGVDTELSVVARQGSGSACRSMYGGFVQWKMGERHDGKDSVAEQVAPETHWPELRVLVLVVSAERKLVGSTSGMQTSVQTSKLLKLRAENVVPARMDEMIRAIHERDFETFAELTMKDSNQFHATCLDTFPPIFYLNDISRKVINLVHRYNQHYRETRVAYTFDAGPNAVIYLLRDHVAEFVQAVRHFFPPESNGGEFVKGQHVPSASLPEELIRDIGMEPTPRGISYIISTK
ncbi:diphosphomevalonate decarboxylase, partial [Clarias magur]